MKRCECNRKKPLNVDESIADDKSTHEPNLDTDNEINSEHKRKVVITGDIIKWFTRKRFIPESPCKSK